jgi:hypothetical protein
MKRLLFSLIICSGWICNSQTITEADFEEHVRYPHETAHAHLNKSVLIVGEQLAFKAYIYDRKNRVPSSLTTNLYCVLENAAGATFHESMLLVSNGTAYHTINIDSTYTAGDYQLKLYTEWMKNQNDAPEFVAPLKVIANSSSGLNTSIDQADDLDIQIFPEGGKIVTGLRSTMGLLVKDSKGKGVEIKNAQIKSREKTITTTSTNNQGTGRFYVEMDSGDTYQISFTHHGKSYNKKLPQPRSQGLVMNMNVLSSTITCTIKTNAASLTQWSGDYQLAIYSDAQMKLQPLTINQEEQTSLIDRAELPPGVNMVTLFNKLGKPVLQRTFFNYDNLPQIALDNVETLVVADSIVVKVQLQEKDRVADVPWGTASISVLPAGTKVIDSSKNIVSRFLLNTHIRGQIDDANYYFKDVNRRVQYDMDNLMLTQGWATYDWDNLWSEQNQPTHAFEQGITFNAAINSRNLKQFIIYPLRTSGTTFIDVESDQKNFTVGGLMAIQDEKLRIGGIDKKGKSVNPKLYPRFSPNAIPDYQTGFVAAPISFDADLESTQLSSLSSSAELLEQVVVKAEVESRRDLIERTQRGNVDIFDDADRARTVNIAQYLTTRGFSANQNEGQLVVTNNRRGNIGPTTPPIFYLNDVIYRDPSILATINPSIIDYIVINRTGFGEAVNSNGGVIKIYTDPRLAPSSGSSQSSTGFDVPLTFAQPAEYYAPRFVNYNSRFFQELGIVDFKGNQIISSTGLIEFTIPNLLVEKYLLVVEGITDDGGLFHHEILVN